MGREDVDTTSLTYSGQCLLKWTNTGSSNDGGIRTTIFGKGCKDVTQSLLVGWGRESFIRTERTRQCEAFRQHVYTINPHTVLSVSSVFWPSADGFDGLHH